ncbi:hypothetical protein [Ferruginibacter sp.]
MKRFSFGLIAVLMAVGFAAFTTPQTIKKNKLENHLYRYTLTNNTGKDNPANYVFTSSSSGCSQGSAVVCIISAPGTDGMGNHPDFPNPTNPYSNSEGVSVEVEKAAP